MKQLPIDGQIRHVLVFPLLPIVCNSQERIWLEWAVVKQRYTYGHGNVLEGWENICYAKDQKQQVNSSVGVVAFLWKKISRGA